MSKRYGERVRDARRRLGMTQKELAEKMGVTCRAVVAWEQKDVRPRYLKRYYRLADVLNIDVNYLIADDVTFKTCSINDDIIKLEKRLVQLENEINECKNLLEELRMKEL